MLNNTVYYSRWYVCVCVRARLSTKRGVYVRINCNMFVQSRI